MKLIVFCEYIQQRNKLVGVVLNASISIFHGISIECFFLVGLHYQYCNVISLIGITYFPEGSNKRARWGETINQVCILFNYYLSLQFLLISILAPNPDNLWSRGRCSNTYYRLIIQLYSSLHFSTSFRIFTLLQYII